MNVYLKYSVCLFVALLSCKLTVFAQQTVEKSLQSLMEKYEAVGLAVSVVRDGKIIYSESFGKKNLETGEHLAPQDMFRIASISKSFSATAVMQLVEAGRLRLDDDVSGLIGFRVRNPAYPEDRITLKMLLSHTSGLNDSQGYFTLDVVDPARNDSVHKCYNAYRPGAAYQYCNLNFNMVGTIIERVSGERFDQYIRRHILEPLGLYGGYCVDSLDKARFVTLYEYDAAAKKMNAAPAAYHPRSEEIRNYITGRSTPVFSPTGGMKISAADLARYMTMHMNLGKYKGGRIISARSARLMQTPVENAEGYGLALVTSGKLVDGLQLKGHTGSAYGLYSLMFFDPERKFGIVTITNGCSAQSADGFNELLSSVFRAVYEDMIR